MVWILLLSGPFYTLSLDHRTAPLGTATCGPGAAERHLLSGDSTYRYRFLLVPANAPTGVSFRRHPDIFDAAPPADADRRLAVGTVDCNRRPAKKQGSRPSALYAQHKVNTDIVTVFTRRGREVYTRRFGDVVLSSRIDGDDLKVETVNGGRYVCDAWTGILLESEAPAKPAICADILNAA